MFSKYFQSELSFLRESGKAFARAHPQLASLLSERGGDPDVERLLEGFAFLTARIRERLDDAVPEVSYALAELLIPQFLRPLPSCAVVELTPQIKALKSAVRVAAGAELGASPVEGTSCRFRTVDDVELLPVTLMESALEAGTGGTAALRISLQTTEAGRAPLFAAEKLRFYLHGELPTTSLLFLWLNRHLTAVTATPAGGGTPVILPTSAFVPSGLSAPPLFPAPRTATPGHGALLEYFTLPQRFLFFDVRGLGVAADRLGDRFDLHFRFDRTPPLAGHLPRDTVKLHCVPVVNLFSTSADPLRQEIQGQPLFVRGSGVDPLHMEVYSIERVEGLRAGGERLVHPPFSAFSHLGNEPGPPFYEAVRTRSPLDAFSDTTLRLGTPIGVTPPMLEETISLDLVCTNRGLAGKLGVGDIRMPTGTSPTLAQFRNITPVTQPVPPPMGEELHWQLLAHLAVNQRSLTQPETLRALLGLYNFQIRADQGAARANSLRAESIQKIDSAPGRRFVEGVPVRGMRVAVTLDEGRLAGQGDAFLLGAVLDGLFASAVTLNAFSELAVKLVPSQVEHRWTARNGERRLA